MLHAVIMSGGSGTRFWPRSRTSQPKQLLPLLGGDSLLQRTVARIEALIPGERTWIVTNRAQEQETRRQLSAKVPAENILIEPFGRDTAPCIGLAAEILRLKDPDARMVVLPADHLIEPAEAFRAVLEQASAAIDGERVVTLGARPNYPATGFGYIEMGEALEGFEGLNTVLRFKEKPALETAKEYVAQKQFLWNCGIFLWHSRTVLDEIQKNKPALAEGLKRIASAFGSEHYESVLEKEYGAFEKVSIDYAVLEHKDDIAVAAIDFSWNDLGSWQAVESLYEANDEGHRVVEAEHVSIDSERCFVYGNGRTIATVGVKDLVVIQTEDATLICPRERVQDVKKVVAELQQRGRRELLT